MHPTIGRIIHVRHAQDVIQTACEPAIVTGRPVGGAFSATVFSAHGAIIEAAWRIYVRVDQLDATWHDPRACPDEPQ